MIIAAMGDIHGNAKALDAVLDDIDSFGILTILHTGDCVCGHDGNTEVLATLQERNVPGALGEWDHRLLRIVRKRKTLSNKLSEQDFAMLDAAYRQCSSSQMEYLDNLVRLYTQTLDGISIALCHGTLSSFRNSMSADNDDNVYLRQRELVPARIIINGRTHVAHSRTLGDTLFVNPGSVGMNEDGKARYAIISTESAKWDVDFREVSV
ncbi:MAG: metallophosphoesterase family protein [Candidatus Hydrogenedentota bacterium]